LRDNLDAGHSLSESLREHPKVFSPLFISIVAVGEQTGRLGPALQRMAEILEAEQEARDKAMHTMMYPTAIMAMSLMTLFVLMTVALPPLIKVFDQMGANVPGITKAAIGGAAWFSKNIPQVGGSLVLVVATFMLLRRIPPVRFHIDVVKTRLPILGPLFIASDLARFSRTMAMLLAAEVPLSAALHQGIQSTNNLALRRAFQDAEDSLLSGHGLSDALKGHPILPSMFRELVRIGEETNSLDRTLADSASAYQKLVERRLNAVLGMMEPVSTLIVGGIVAFIAISMFMPIYSGLNSFN
jgi:type IV pilus assembly protein PilC